ncbi:MAG: hypothetical protein AB9873_13155 [Syntrophobacteraceae bacterium]
MEVFASPFWLPKGGNSLDEYEDAFHLGAKGEVFGDNLPFAVADGASEGMLSREWAKILVQTFCRNKDFRENAMSFLERAYRSWNAWIKSYFKRRERQNKPIQWFEEDGFRNGAFSTLLGLRLIRPGDERTGRWEAIAVGDSCLFHVRSDSLIASFPLKNSIDFNNSPFLIPTNRSKGRNLANAFKGVTGDFSVDDQFYLMTDAIACWFLTEIESNRHPWRILRDFDTEDSQVTFQEWVSSLRAAKKMRNDDVTLVRVEILS